MFVLDTCIVSELRKSRSQADPGLIGWADGVPATEMYLSTMSLCELELGVPLAERRDRATGSVLRTWLSEAVVPSFARRMLPIDGQVAALAASLHMPDLAPLADSLILIAATALAHDMALVTRNVADFDRFVGLLVINPFET